MYKNKKRKLMKDEEINLSIDQEIGKKNLKIEYNWRKGFIAISTSLFTFIFFVSLIILLFSYFFENNHSLYETSLFIVKNNFFVIFFIPLLRLLYWLDGEFITKEQEEIKTNKIKNK